MSDLVLKETEQRLQIENGTLVSFRGTSIRVTLVRVAGTVDLGNLRGIRSADICLF